MVPTHDWAITETTDSDRLELDDGLPGPGDETNRSHASSDELDGLTALTTGATRLVGFWDGEDLGPGGKTFAERDKCEYSGSACKDGLWNDNVGPSLYAAAQGKRDRF